MRQCDITGKKGLRIQKLSHSNHSTNYTQFPNLQTVRVKGADGRPIKLKVSAHGIRILKKQGLIPTAAK